MANKQMKRSSPSLVMQKCKLDHEILLHILLKMAKIQKMDHTKGWKEHKITGNFTHCKWKYIIWKLFGKQFDSF